MREIKKFAQSFNYNINYDSRDNIYIAKCAELPDLMAHGKTQVEALNEILKVVGSTLQWLKEEGSELPKPFSLINFSGKIGLRMTPEQHRKVAIKASLLGISINKYITSKL
jgi:predicted HicB family RNase H-like nuclease